MRKIVGRVMAAALVVLMMLGAAGAQAVELVDLFLGENASAGLAPIYEGVQEALAERREDPVADEEELLAWVHSAMEEMPDEEKPDMDDAMLVVMMAEQLRQEYDRFYDEMQEELDGLAPEDMRVLSVSPDGTKLLLAYGSVLFVEDALDGGIKVIGPDFLSSAFGVRTGLAPLITFIQRLSNRLYDTASFVWSPDGQYIALASWEMAMQQFYQMNLFLVDTQEGRMSMAVSYEGEENLGGDRVYQVCFSADGKTLYQGVYAGMSSSTMAYRTMLFAYDMETGENRPVAAAGDEATDVYGDLRDLVRLKNGEMAAVMDVMSNNGHPVGLYVYKPEGTGSLLRRDAVRLSRKATVLVRPWNLQASEQSGYGLVGFQRRTDGRSTLLSMFSQVYNFEGLDKALVFRRGGIGVEVEAISLEDLVDDAGEPSEMARTLYPGLVADAEAGPEAALLVTSFALSPDGEYALVLLRDPAQAAYQMALLELGSLTVSPVSVEIPQERVKLLEQMPSGTRISMQWAPGGIVLVAAPRGSIVYRMPVIIGEM